MKTIEVTNLTKCFNSFIAVDKISFSVSSGEIFGFLGANGAGKTTAIKMLCGLIHPSSGSGKVAGYDIYKEPERIKKSIGYMSQKFSLYEDLSVIQNMEFFGGIYGMSNKDIKSRISYVLTDLDLLKYNNETIKSLPLGIKQKVSFAVSTFHEPQIVFLDEPTGGVDPVTRRTFWELIYKTSNQGTTFFVTTHYMDEAEYCNRISIMVNGKIKALGSPSELKKEYNLESIEEIFNFVVKQEMP